MKDKTAARLFQGRGKCARLVREQDWSTSPLGSLDQWPQSLRTALSICLNSRFPIAIWWGAHGIQLYNDAFLPMAGAKHPRSKGISARVGTSVYLLKKC